MLTARSAAFWRRPATALAAALALLAGCAAPGGGPEPADRGAACAVIFSTNDSHGRLLPEEPAWAEGRLAGGSAALSGHLDEARREAAPCPVFVLSAGDLMQGTAISNLTDGESTVAVYDALGYDALAIGNHEFDWGVEVLRERIRQASFPFLGANIFLKGTDRHPEWVRPWAILERDGVRVGVVGATTRSTPTTTRPVNVETLEFRSIAAALDRYIPELRERDVDFVVAVMHAGGFCDEEGRCEGEALDELRAASERFDYAVTGHTHSRLETAAGGAPVVQSFANTTAYGLGRLERRAGGDAEARILGIRTTWVDEVEADSAVVALVERYAARLAGELERVVATLGEPLARRGSDFGLGRLIADAQRRALGTRVAIMNDGGIRRDLPAGPVTFSDLFELQPFQNTLVRLRATGQVIRRALEHAVASGTPRAHLSGLTARWDPEAPAGERVRAVELDGGDALHPDSLYTLTVNDFMAAGGSGYDMFADALEAVDTGLVDVDALAEHLAALPQPVRAPPEPRWIADHGADGR